MVAYAVFTTFYGNEVYGTPSLVRPVGLMVIAASVYKLFFTFILLQNIGEIIDRSKDKSLKIMRIIASALFNFMIISNVIYSEVDESPGAYIYLLESITFLLLGIEASYYFQIFRPTAHFF